MKVEGLRKIGFDHPSLFLSLHFQQNLECKHEHEEQLNSEGELVLQSNLLVIWLLSQFQVPLCLKSLGHQSKQATKLFYPPMYMLEKKNTTEELYS